MVFVLGRLARGGVGRHRPRRLVVGKIYLLCPLQQLGKNVRQCCCQVFVFSRVAGQICLPSTKASGQQLSQWLEGTGAARMLGGRVRLYIVSPCRTAGPQDVPNKQPGVQFTLTLLPSLLLFGM